MNHTFNFLSCEINMAKVFIFTLPHINIKILKTGTSDIYYYFCVKLLKIYELKTFFDKLFYIWNIFSRLNEIVVNFFLLK